MSNLTDYTEGKVIDLLFRTAGFSKPSNLYFALFTAAPSDSGGGTEVSSGGYARVQVTPADANFSRTGNVVKNLATITFPTPNAAWGTITHYAIFDAASGGNMVAWGVLDQSKVVGNGDPAPEWQPNAFIFTFNLTSDYLAGALADHLFRSATLAKPSNLYFALYTAAPTSAGGGTEVAGGSYSRPSVTPADTAFTAPSAGNGQTSNSNAITFPAPTAAWGIILATAIMDASTGGNMLAFGSFGAKNVNSGDSAPRFGASALTYTLA